MHFLTISSLTLKTPDFMRDCAAMKNKTNKTKGHSVWLLKNRNLFFTILESRKSKVKAPANLESGESRLSDS